MSDDPKLRELRPEMRVKVAAILDELTARGYSPRISNAYRTWAQQAQKIKEGAAMPGARDPGAHNWGLACDVIDKRWGWKVSEENARFFAALADLATEHGLVTGGHWFGAGGTREKPTHRSEWNRWGLGWDVAHIEWRNPSAGWRRDWSSGILEGG